MRREHIILLVLVALVSIAVVVVLQIASRDGRVERDDRSGQSMASESPAADPLGRAELESDSTRVPLSREPALPVVERSPEGVEAFDVRLARMKARADEWADIGQWAQTHALQTVDELKNARTAIEATILEAVGDELEKRFAEGDFEVLNEGTTYSGSSSDFNPYDVYWVRIPPGGPVQKCTLPEVNHLEIYRLRAHSAWLSARVYALGGHL
jgi:hypothetical protein